MAFVLFCVFNMLIFLSEIIVFAFCRTLYGSFRGSFCNWIDIHYFVNSIVVFWTFQSSYLLSSCVERHGPYICDTLSFARFCNDLPYIKGNGYLFVQMKDYRFSRTCSLNDQALAIFCWVSEWLFLCIKFLHANCSAFVSFHPLYLHYGRDRFIQGCVLCYFINP